MADAISGTLTSSHPNYGPNQHSTFSSTRSLYQLGVAPQSMLQPAPQENGNADSLHHGAVLAAQSFNETPLGSDPGVAEVVIRRLKREIEHAQEELRELEENFVRDLTTPPLREWLFPLMVIGLVLSLYGSFSATNVAELGATGLVMLWSLSAFWFIYTRDNRMAKAKAAHEAEIEIWSNRIAELENSLAHNQRLAELVHE